MGSGKDVREIFFIAVTTAVWPYSNMVRAEWFFQRHKAWAWACNSLVTWMVSAGERSPELRRRRWTHRREWGAQRECHGGHSAAGTAAEVTAPPATLVA